MQSHMDPTTLTLISLQCAFSYVFEGRFYVKNICYKLNSCKVSLQCVFSYVPEDCLFVKTICYKLNSCKVSL
jgi:hypothetical protein